MLVLNLVIGPNVVIKASISVTPIKTEAETAGVERGIIWRHEIY